MKLKTLALFVLLSVFLPIVLAQQTLVYDEAGSIEFTHSIEGRAIVLKTHYTSSYEKWRITDNKDLEIRLFVITKPPDVTLYVEHMHADCFIHAYREGMDGMLQDTMDDKLHVGIQPGFLVDQEKSYEEIFSIEGYSQWLTSGWMFYCGGYGRGEVSTERLTESELIKNKVVGSECVAVFDILIERDGKFYKQIVKDNFYVFLEGKGPSNTADFLKPEDEEEKIVKTVWHGEPNDTYIVVGVLVAIIGLVMGRYYQIRCSDWAWVGYGMFVVGLIIIGLGISAGWSEEVIVPRNSSS